ncbi:protein FAR1-RELATED SEQUENCE 5-like [Lolium perenne]|uniref:protein FAR1-RELATED SEQUENCE 5-like n=1 Tax=Lolium perenne TaxID=4522 RepID=UPI0021F64044|nr:protein FAR1-RELATED SEQUENCE 7-like [Lolium perenne]
MDPEYAPGLLDLNEPIPEDVSVFDDLQKEHTPVNTARTSSNADVTKSSEQSKHASGSNIGASSGQSKHASGSNIGASADTHPIIGETLSTDDSGGDDDDEVQSTPVSQTEVQTPYPGMIFDSWDEAKMHYNIYAKKFGFSIKCSTSKNSTLDGQKDKQMFVCNKNGKNEDINMQEAAPVRRRNKSITKKTECKARLRIKRKGTKWHVTYFIEEHNHSMIKKFSLKKYLRSHKGIPKEERDFVKLLHKVNLSAGRVMRIMGEVYGGLANVPYDSKSVSNFMATINEDQTIKDISKLLSHFARLKKEDPDFYFNLHTDHVDKVDRIFWVDGPAIAAYKNYNDCLSFDTTYMTNMYNMPFAPFIGINRYCQSIQLGCGFLKNENVESFVWLFQEFLEAIGGLQPQNFITDQDAAMRSAILAEFPNCCHRNCRWHIMQNAQAVLRNFLSKHEELRQELNAIIDYSMSVDEFETRWADMLRKHNVADNTHLADLYHLRATFVPAYFKDRFFPFLQTTARSEGFNAVLKTYSYPHYSLHHFFEQYLKLQEKINVAEDSVEFLDEDKTFRVWGDYPIEEQALKVYTRPIYLRLRAELCKVTSYNVQLIGGQSYDVLPIKAYVYGYGSRSYQVEANVETETYSCECCKFSRDGLLCCHIFRVMVQLGCINKILEKYILDRWRVQEENIVEEKMDLPKQPVGRKMNNKERQQLRYGTLCNDNTRVARMASTSEKGKAIADKYMLALEKELLEMKASESAKRKKKKQAAPSFDEEPDVENVGDDGQGNSSKFDHVEDPVYIAKQGRPAEKRKKYGLHLKATKVVKCSVCGSIQHTAATCKDKITPGPESKEIDFFRDMV